jgi:hypothetical protein
MAQYIVANPGVVHSLNEIVTAYRRITRVGGGSWIFQELKQFILKFKRNPLQRRKFMKLMESAMASEVITEISSDDYPHQFFHWDENTGLLVPLCGLVNIIMNDLIPLLHNQDHQDTMTTIACLNCFDKNLVHSSGRKRKLTEYE